MFNLDRAIAEWRRQMQAAGIKTPVLLDELESHLRDDVQQQVRASLSVQQAFEAAVQRVGQASVLKAEFEKAGETKRARERKLMGLLTLGCACIYSLFAGVCVVFKLVGRKSLGIHTGGSSLRVLHGLEQAAFQKTGWTGSSLRRRGI